MPYSRSYAAANLRQELIRRLAATKPRRSNVRGRRAAVVVTVVERKNDPYIVFTKRTRKVAAHQGEISFPGGVREPGDRTLLDTALREAGEELGVEIPRTTVIGRLNDVPTFVSGFVITPFVSYISPGPRWRPSSREVAEVLEVPLAHLLDPQHRREEVRKRLGRPYGMVSFRYRGRLIWGATARVVAQLLDLLSR